MKFLKRIFFFFQQFNLYTLSTSHRLQQANTMKQKVVIKVTLHGQKCQSKALQTVVSILGVESAAFKANDKSHIEVIGEIDVVKLTTMLRKKVGYAEIVSVSAVGEKKEEKKDDKKIEFVHSYSLPYSAPNYYYVCEPPRDPPCSIL